MQHELSVHWRSVIKCTATEPRTLLTKLHFLCNWRMSSISITTPSMTVTMFCFLGYGVLSFCVLNIWITKRDLVCKHLPKLKKMVGGLQRSYSKLQHVYSSLALTHGLYSCRKKLVGVGGWVCSQCYESEIMLSVVIPSVVILSVAAPLFSH